MGVWQLERFRVHFEKVLGCGRRDSKVEKKGFHTEGLFYKSYRTSET